MVKKTLVTLMFCLPLAGQDQRPMTFVDLLNVERPGQVELSPDGSQILFTLSQADWKKDRSVNHIWRIGSDGSDPIQMTNGAAGERSPGWSPDGRWFAFLAERDDSKMQIFLQSARGGEARQLSRHETAVRSFQWAPDGNGIYFLASDAPSSEEKEFRKEIGEAYSFDRNFEQRHLWVLNLRDESEERVTEGDFSVLSAHLSRDGKMMVMHAAPTPLIDDSDESEVWILDLASGRKRQLTRNGIAERGGRLSPDNRTVAFTAGADENFEGYHLSNLFLVPAGGGAAQPLLPDYRYEIQSFEWADPLSIYFQANMGVHTEFFRVDVATREIVQLTDGAHSLSAWDFEPGPGRLAYLRSTPVSPGDIWVMDTTGGEPTQVSDLHRELARTFRLPRTEAITWKSSDGVVVEGILAYPLDYEKGRRYPLATQIHGGPSSSYRLSFSSAGNYVPVLAAAGYAVFQPNYRGSTGYGNAFLRDMVGHYFNLCDDDVMTGIDHLVDKGLVDPDQLVIMGWSAGGHMTNWLVTQTDRFKAASSGAGASNWISMYGQSDVRIYRTPWFLGTPWEKDAPLDTYLKHSPIRYVSNATTPTLILVGEKDLRVPMPQSVEMFRGLRSNGVSTELIVFPGQPHGLRRLKHRLYKMNKEMSWFEEHVRGRSFTMEKPPGEDRKETD